MSTDLVSAVNKAAEATRARFRKITKGGLGPIPTPLRDEVARLAAVRPADADASAVSLFKDMAKDGYALRAAALLGSKPVAIRFHGLGPTDPRHVINDKSVRGEVIDGFQALLPAAAAIKAAGQKLDLPANVLAALEV